MSSGSTKNDWMYNHVLRIFGRQYELRYVEGTLYMSQVCIWQQQTENGNFCFFSFTHYHITSFISLPFAWNPQNNGFYNVYAVCKVENGGRERWQMYAKIFEDLVQTLIRIMMWNFRNGNSYFSQCKQCSLLQ